MDRFVLLLRGVNVGGLKMSMAQLSAALSDAGFAQVRTVLATGNAVFDSPQDSGQVLQCAHQALQRKFGVPVQCLLHPRAGFRALLPEPFPLEPPTGDFHRYMSFTRDPRSARALAAELPGDVEQYVLRGPVLYWFAAKGSSTSSQLATALQRLSKGHLLTTRNLNTVHKVAKLL